MFTKYKFYRKKELFLLQGNKIQAEPNAIRHDIFAKLERHDPFPKEGNSSSRDTHPFFNQLIFARENHGKIIRFRVSLLLLLPVEEKFLMFFF